MTNELNQIETSYAQLPITKGRGDNKIVIGYVKVDLDDYHQFSEKSLCLNSYGYPIYSDGSSNKFVHRIVMKAKKGEVVDHIYHDKLDARKQNLRIVSQKENNQNLKLRNDNISGHRGVQKRGENSWEAYIVIDNKYYSLGTYTTVELAAQASKNARAKKGYLDEGILPEIVPVEHLQTRKRSTIYKYITWVPQFGYYRIRFRHEQKPYHVATTKSLKEAIEIRNNKLIELGRSIPCE